MNSNSARIRKLLLFFHMLSGAVALVAVSFYLFYGNFALGYKVFLTGYIFSGAMLLIFFYKTFTRVQQRYFELLFSVPFLLAAFWFFTWLFEYYFFGK